LSDKHTYLARTARLRGDGVDYEGRGDGVEHSYIICYDT
jgi:hypothetical protein